MRWLAAAVLLCALPARAGTLDGLAGALAGHVAVRGDVALAVHAHDPSLARLCDTLEGLLVARLPGSRALRAGAAEARRQGFAAFVDVELFVDKGEVVATGRVMNTERNLWRAAAGVQPEGIASSFAQRAPLDAELRAYVGSGAPVATRERRMSFRPLRGALDLGAPLLALAATGAPGELVALTTDQVALLRLGPGGATAVASYALAGPPPVPRPRDPVGTLALAGGQIIARSSEHAAGVTLALAGGTLVKVGETVAFVLCDGKAATLAPGRHILVDAAGDRLLSAGCGAGLTGTVDASGTLRLTHPGDAAPWATVRGAGTAFAIADVDGDGAPELATAAYRAPGTGDVLTVYRLGAGGAPRPARRGTPVAGGVAALAAVDADGDGVIDMVAAVRAADAAPRYELWLLE